MERKYMELIKSRKSTKTKQGKYKKSVTSNKSYQSKLSLEKTPMTLTELQSFERPNSAILLAYREYNKATNVKTNIIKLQKKVAEKALPEVPSNKKILAKGPPSTMRIPEGITDVDKNYFNIIQVRSKYKTRKLNRHQYITDINNCLKQNIVTGYFYDQIFKIDEQFETEKNKLTKIQDNFSKLSAYFEQFLDDDHKESMNLIAAANRETTAIEKKRTILRKKQEMLGKIRNDIYSYEEIYDRTLSCTSFILSITPKDFYNEEEMTKSTSQKRRSSLLSSHSLDDLENEIELVQKLKPKLYFKDPNDILQIFRDIEVQNLKFMLHTLEFKAKIQEEIDLINSLKIFSEVELRGIRWKVLKTENAIKNIEIQTKELEERCKVLLEEEYKKFVFGNDSILLHAYISETCSYLLNTEPDESTTKNMAALEDEYEELRLQADNVPSDLLKSIMSEGYSSNKQLKIKAKIANRKLIDFDNLIKKTLKLLDKPQIIKRRKLMTRSPVTTKPVKKPPPPPPISEEEILKRYLFTNMCRPQHPYSLKVDKDEDQYH